MIRIAFILCLLFIERPGILAQCSSGISAYPYNENFETSDGGWVAGGSGNDWAWGTPSKPVISSAGGGTKCWIIGGLTGSTYTDAEASWLQSPCYDFTGVLYPYIEFKVFWEMEQQFDGGGFQYSTDNGSTWINVGSVSDGKNCLNANWFNYSPVTYLSPLTSTRDGWSGNIQSTAGSCKGGNGSNGWVVAKHTMPYLAGKPGVIFRFIFGAGTICNNYDGFAIDDIAIGEAPPNAAAFTYSCINNNTANFINASAFCPDVFSWDFGDPASGPGNTSNMENPSHTFSSTGKYTVTLTVSGPGNAPSTIAKEINIISATVTMGSAADCQTNSGGSLFVSAGTPGLALNYLWNTIPAQTGIVASNLGYGSYTVAVSGTDVCTATASGKVELNSSCTGVYFPSAFTPGNDGVNDGFGPLGSLAALTEYKLRVYNRWGQEVFSSVNPFEKWNGRVMGAETGSHVFVWSATFVVSGKPREMRKGTVVLIK